MTDVRGATGASEPYPVESYEDLTDVTVSERPWLTTPEGPRLLLVILSVLGIGAVLGFIGWSARRGRRQHR